MKGRWQTSSGGAGWQEASDVSGVVREDELQASVGEHNYVGGLRRTSSQSGFISTETGVVRVSWSRDATGVWVTVDGRTVLFKPAASAGAAEAGGSLSSPMPARVLKVEVGVGEDVEAGQTLLVLEAMKMEHALKAPAAGTVMTIRAAVGDQVEAGVPLVDIE